MEIHASCHLISAELGPNYLLLLNVNQDEVHQISRTASGLALGKQNQHLAGDQAQAHWFQ